MLSELPTMTQTPYDEDQLLLVYNDLPTKDQLAVTLFLAAIRPALTVGAVVIKDPKPKLLWPTLIN